MKFLFTILMGSFFGLATYAQVNDSISPIKDSNFIIENIAADSLEETAFSSPVPRRISPDSVNTLKKMEAFSYMKNIDSFFRHRKIPKEAEIKTGSNKPKFILRNPGLRTLYWIIAFLLVIIIVWKMFIGRNALFANNRRFISSPAKPGVPTGKNPTPEEQVSVAIASGNFRLAVRYLYIETLEMLGQKGLLAITPQKTNYQYVQELNNDRLQKTFGRLTLHYEYTWFGEFALNQQQFNTIHRAFLDFKTSLP